MDVTDVPQHDPPKDALLRGLSYVLTDRKATIDSGELLEAIFRKWGGADEFAEDIHSEYKKASPGSMTRQRCLEMVQRLIIWVTERDMAKTKKPSEMSTEELHRYAEMYMKRVLADGKDA